MLFTHNIHVQITTVGNVMSFEEEIRRKHRYEAGVRQFEGQILDFLSACRIYDREALELIMARLLDRIQASSDPEVIIDAKFKGSLTKMVFDDRLRGQERSRRPFFWAALLLG